MKHQHDDRQCSLFDEPAPEKPEVADEPPSLQPFEPALLEIIDHEGEPRATGMSICAATHYGELWHFREFIERLDKVEEWGSISYRTRMIRTGKGAHRSIKEPLLSEQQLYTFCMRSNQPNMAATRALIAKVFIAWRHGKLRAADAETEVKLQEATDRTIDEMPGILAFFHGFGADQKATRKAAERAARAAEESIANQRRYPEAETVRSARWVNKNNYRDRCPCCQRVILGADGGVWAHMKGKYRRTVRDGWFVCEKCNIEYENSKNTTEIYIAFIAYLGHVEAYLAQGQFSFGRKP